jgi:hypothetical protein
MPAPLSLMLRALPGGQPGYGPLFTSSRAFPRSRKNPGPLTNALQAWLTAEPPARVCASDLQTLAVSAQQKVRNECEGAHVRRVRGCHRGPSSAAGRRPMAARATPRRRARPARREARIRRARPTRSTTSTASCMTPSVTNTFPACASRHRKSVRWSPGSGARWRRTLTRTRPRLIWRTTPPRRCQPGRRCTRSRGSRRGVASRRTWPATRVPTSR